MNIMRTEVQDSLANIALTMSFSPVAIPAELRNLSPIDAIHQRLKMHVDALGGYEVLASKCLPKRAKIWQSKIERIGRYRLSVEEFCMLIKLFRDPVLVALLAKNHHLFDLNGIPRSEYGRADLVWNLRRYAGLVGLLNCDLREILLNGGNCKHIKQEIFESLKEAIVLLRQIQIELHMLGEAQGFQKIQSKGFPC